MTESPLRMTPRPIQAALLLALTACGGSPSATAQDSSAGAERPFTVTPVADFETPWAMTFLPGSGVRMTNMALITEREGRLWLVGHVARTAHTRFGRIYDAAAEALIETHPGVARCAVVALGQPGQQEAALVVSVAPGQAPKGDPKRVELERDILRLAESSQVTRDIRRVLVRDALPLDPRWHAQVRVRELAEWITTSHG